MQINFNITLITLGIYLGILVILGLLSKYYRQENTYSDFYLANRNMNTFILGFTLFATQYSGNTLLAMPANTYRTGFNFLVSVTFFIAIIGAYLLYAPRLQSLSRQHGFITPCDFVNFRWRSTSLSMIANLIFIVVLVCYIITNLKVMGLVVSYLTADRISFTEAIMGLTVIILIYETVGGMRAVAWTDAIQGIILLVGCLCIFALVNYEYGSIFSHLTTIQENRPDFFNPPDAKRFSQWLNTLLLVAFGASVYPQAIQRIFAAKSETSLKKSLKMMLFLPFFTTLPMIIIGIMGVAIIPGLDKTGSETVILQIIGDLVHKIPAFSWVALLFFTAVVAAIMSTIDSVILTLSSIVTKDIYLTYFSKTKENKLGKSAYTSWVIMAPCLLLAIYLPQTLWRLIEFKLELLIQVSPLFFIGLYATKIKAIPFIVSTLTGIFFVVSMNLSGIKISGINTGIIALAANLSALFIIVTACKYRQPIIEAIPD